MHGPGIGASFGGRSRELPRVPVSVPRLLAVLLLTACAPVPELFGLPEQQRR